MLSCDKQHVCWWYTSWACLSWKLEQILIAQGIVFEKIIVMPKGQQRKVKGAICNVPVDCDQTSSLLPCPPERSDIIMLIHNSEVMYTFKQ